MQRPPHFRRGIARLWPLAVIAGVATATTWFLAATWASRTRPHPVRVLPPAACLEDPIYGGEPMPLPVPRHKIREASGRLWELADIPGHTLRGLELPGAWWAHADLHGATFADCDMRGLDLRHADLRGCRFLGCNLRGVRLDLHGCH